MFVNSVGRRIIEVIMIGVIASVQEEYDVLIFLIVIITKASNIPDNNPKPIPIVLSRSPRPWFANRNIIPITAITSAMFTFGSFLSLI